MQNGRGTKECGEWGEERVNGKVDFPFIPLTACYWRGTISTVVRGIMDVFETTTIWFWRQFTLSNFFFYEQRLIINGRYTEERLVSKEKQTLTVSWPRCQHVTIQHQRQIQQETSSEGSFCSNKIAHSFWYNDILTSCQLDEWEMTDWCVWFNSDSTVSTSQFSHYVHQLLSLSSLYFDVRIFKKQRDKLF